jgi:hypothetical protein
LRDLWAAAIENYEFANHVPPEFVLRVIALLREICDLRGRRLGFFPQEFNDLRQLLN